MTTPIKFGEKYILLNRLGTGGMAEVYRGKLVGDLGFEKQVVIKKLLPELAEHAESIHHFIDEARLAALLQHDNIATTYDFGNIGGTYFMAMEYLFGKDLFSILQRIRQKNEIIPPEIALHIGLRISEAMAYAHTLADLQNRPLNIIHRDLTPQNIFLTYDGQIKVIDFGIAKNELQENVTQIGVVKGKITYMSPEQMAGNKLDNRSDLFSIGILLYEMLCSQKMYSGSTADLIQKVIKAEFTPLEEKIQGLPLQVYNIVNKLLKDQPSQRYQNCASLSTDLEQCLFATKKRVSSHTLKNLLTNLFEAEYDSEKEARTTITDKTVQYSTLEEEGSLTRSLFNTSITGKPGKTSSLISWLIGGGISLALLLSGFTLFQLYSAPSERPSPRMTPQPIAPNQEMKIAKPESLAKAEIKSKLILQEPEPATPSSTELFIEDLIVKAEEAMAAGKLVGTLDSAHKYFTDILSLDSNNEAAKFGLEHIAGSLKQGISALIKKDNLIKARAQLKQAREGFPEDRQLKNIEKLLKQLVLEKISQLYTEAENSLNDNRLTKPVNNCAYKYYSEIPHLAENNDLYNQGLMKIGDRYATLADTAFQDMDFKKSRVLVEEGLKITPDHQQLNYRKTQLSRSAPGVFFQGIKENFKKLAE